MRSLVDVEVNVDVDVDVDVDVSDNDDHGDGNDRYRDHDSDHHRNLYCNRDEYYDCYYYYAPFAWARGRIRLNSDFFLATTTLTA